jgi:hypothetical protein
MLRLLSHDEMILRMAQRAALESARERDTRESASRRYGRAAEDFAGFEDVLAARVEEAMRAASPTSSGLSQTTQDRGDDWRGARSRTASTQDN